MPNTILGVPAFLALAAVDWLAAAFCWKRIHIFFKPASILALLVWFWLTVQSSGELVHLSRWFIAGLAFSMLGDIFLLSSRSRFFLGGLTAFLVAHLAYVVGLNPGFPAVTLPLILIVAVIAVWSLFYYRQVRQALARMPRGKRLQIGVLLYSLVISLMLISTFATLLRPEWNPAAARWVALGGTFFYASDSILAYDRFIRPFRRARAVVMITYHLGQLALAWGAAMQVGAIL